MTGVDNADVATLKRAGTAVTKQQEKEEKRQQQQQQPKMREAAEVFLLMHRNCRVSRNIRANWFFEHLGKGVHLHNSTDDQSNELFVYGLTAKNAPEGEQLGNESLLITKQTRMTFISKLYRHVYVLDLSPSTLVADDEAGCCLFNLLIDHFKAAVYSLTRQMVLPGKRLTLRPQIYLTVLVYTPYLCFKEKSVLMQGVLVTNINVRQVLDDVEQKFRHFVHSLHSYSQPIVAEWGERNDRGKRRSDRAPSPSSSPFPMPERGRGQRQKLPASHKGDTRMPRPTEIAHELDELGYARQIWTDISGEATATLEGGAIFTNASALPPCDGYVHPEWSLIFMIRSAILAIQMLPGNTQSNIILITDAVCGMPEPSALQDLLAQLRSLSVACSFIQVQGRVRSEPSFGHVASCELFHFLAVATFGAYMPNCKCITADSTKGVNSYQRQLLCWWFEKALQRNTHILSIVREVNEMFAEMYMNDIRRHRESRLNYDCSIRDLMYVRLREGYTIKEIRDGGGKTVIVMILPIRQLVCLEYTITAAGSLRYKKRTSLKAEVTLIAPYNVLHELIASPTTVNPTRQKAVRAYRYIVDGIVESDRILTHLHSFYTQRAYYTIPEGLTHCAIGLFRAEDPPPTKLEYDEEFYTRPRFDKFWCQLIDVEERIWQKWTHTHQIRLLITPTSRLIRIFTRPDEPIDFRRSLNIMHEFLTKESSFCLLHEQIYVTFVDECPGIPPRQFYVLRITGSPPLITLRVSFIGGMTNHRRVEIMRHLSEGLMELHIVSADLEGRADIDDARICALTIVSRPIERMLITYKALPRDIHSMIALPSSSDAIPSVSEHNALAKYLQARRVIWKMASMFGDRGGDLPPKVASYFAEMMMRRRLALGYDLVWLRNGIAGLGRQTRIARPEGVSASDEVAALSEETRLALEQFVIFPPVSTKKELSKISEAITTKDEHEGEKGPIVDVVIVQEMWIEPGVRTDKACRLIAEEMMLSALFTIDKLLRMCAIGGKVAPVKIHPKRRESRNGTETRLIQFSLGPMMRNSQRHLMLLPFHCDDEVNESDMDRATMTLSVLHEQLEENSECTLNVDEKNRWTEMCGDLERTTEQFADVNKGTPFVLYMRKTTPWSVVGVAVPTDKAKIRDWRDGCLPLLFFSAEEPVIACSAMSGKGGVAYIEDRRQTQQPPRPTQMEVPPDLVLGYRGKVEGGGFQQFDLATYVRNMYDRLIMKSMVTAMFRAVNEGIFVSQRAVQDVTEEYCDYINLEVEGVDTALRTFCCHMKNDDMMSQSGSDVFGRELSPDSVCGDESEFELSFSSILSRYFKPINGSSSYYHFLSKNSPMFDRLGNGRYLSRLAPFMNRGKGDEVESSDEDDDCYMPAGARKKKNSEDIYPVRLYSMESSDDSLPGSRSNLLDIDGDDLLPLGVRRAKFSVKMQYATPLFLYFSCAVRLPSGEMETFPIDSLPSCIHHVVKRAGLDAVDYNVEDVAVSLDLYVLTWPMQIDAYVDKDEGVSYAAGKKKAFLKLLPSRERCVVERLMRSIGYLIEQEMVLMDSRRKEISLDRLEKISDFITREMKVVKEERDMRYEEKRRPLTLVIATPEAKERLKIRLDGMRVDYVRLKRVGPDLFYACKVADHKRFAKHFVKRQQDEHPKEEIHAKPDPTVVVDEPVDNVEEDNNGTVHEAREEDREASRTREQVQQPVPLPLPQRKASLSANDEMRKMSQEEMKMSFYEKLLRINDADEEILERAERQLVDEYNRDHRLNLHDDDDDEDEEDEDEETTETGDMLTFDEEDEGGGLGFDDEMREEEEEEEERKDQYDDYEEGIEEVKRRLATIQEDDGVHDRDKNDKEKGRTTPPKKKLVDVDSLDLTKKDVICDFWMIIRVTDSFHLQFCQRYPHFHHSVIFDETWKKVKRNLRIVNQQMLLEKAHETMEVNSLLLISNKDRREYGSECISDAGTDATGFVDEDTSRDQVIESARYYYTPGSFACPMLHYHWFAVPPRLSTVRAPTKSGSAAQEPSALDVLRTALHTFAATNVDNVYLFKDRRGSVFYMHLHTSIESVESTMREVPTDIRRKAASNEFDTNILLAVHGVDRLNDEILYELPTMLQRQLNASHLDKIVNMFSKNTKASLEPPDVLFIQPNQLRPQFLYHFSLPSSLHQTNLLGAFNFYLRQHLTRVWPNARYRDMRPFRERNPSNDTERKISFEAARKTNSTALQEFLNNEGSFASADHQSINQAHAGVDRKSSYHRQAYRDSRGKSQFDPFFSEITRSLPAAYDPKFNVICRRKEPGSVSYGFGVAEFRLLNSRGQIANLHEGKLSLATRHALLAGDEDMRNRFEQLTRTTYVNLARQVAHKMARDERKNKERRKKMKEKGVRSSSPTTSSTVVEVIVWSKGDLGDEYVRMAAVSFIRQALADIVTEYAMLSPQIIETLPPPSPPMKIRTSATAHTPAPPRAIDIGDASPSDKKALHFSFESGPSSPGSGMGLMQQSSTSKRSPSMHSGGTIFEREDIQRALSCQFLPLLDWFDFVLAKVGEPTERIGMTLSALQRVTMRCNTVEAARKVVDVMARLLDVELSYDHYPDTVTVAERQPYTGRFVVDHHDLFQGIHADLGVDLMEKPSVNEKPMIALLAFVPQVWEDTKRYGLEPIGEPPDSLLELLREDRRELFIPRIPERANQSFIPRLRLVALTAAGSKLTLYTYNCKDELHSLLTNHLHVAAQFHEARLLLLRQIGLHKMGITHLAPAQELEPSEGGTFAAKIWRCTESYLSEDYPPGHSCEATPKECVLSMSRLYRIVEPAFVTAGVRDDIMEDQFDQLSLIREAARSHLLPHYYLSALHKRMMDGTDRISWVDLSELVNASRDAHFVMTPLLLFPLWRRKIASIRQPEREMERDRSRQMTEKYGLSRSDLYPGKDKQRQESASYKNTPSNRNRASTLSVSSHLSASSSLAHHNSFPANSPSILRLPIGHSIDDEDPCHIKLEEVLILEYIEYLVSLGMRPVVVDGRPDRHHCRHPTGGSIVRHNEHPEHWLVMPVDGGIVLAHLCFSPPYFQVRFRIWHQLGVLYPVEDDHEKNKMRNVERAKDDLVAQCHVHSFTYDFHLRMLTKYLLGRDHVLFMPGYNTSAFLVDFLQYYGCRPPCARNCIYEERASFPLQYDVRPDEIWAHFLRHDKMYGWRVVKMKQSDDEGNQSADFMLVQSTLEAQSDRDEVKIVVHDRSIPSTTSLHLVIYLIMVNKSHKTPLSEERRREDSRASEGEFRHVAPLTSVLAPAPAPSSSSTLVTGSSNASSSSAIVRPDTGSASSLNTVVLPQVIVGPESASGSLVPVLDLEGDIEKMVTMVNEGYLPTIDGDRRRFSSGGHPIPPTQPQRHLGPDGDSMGSTGSLFTPSSPLLVRMSGSDNQLTIQENAPRRHRKREESKVDSTGVAISLERAIYVHFLSARQRRLQKVVEDAAAQYRRQMQKCVSDAEWLCRRDNLWQRMLAMPSERRKDGHGFFKSVPADPWHVVRAASCDGVDPSKDLDTLISIVRVVPMSEREPDVPRLTRGLVAANLCRHLVAKFGVERCRFFEYKHSAKKCLLITNPNCLLDSAILISCPKETSPVFSLLIKEHDDADLIPSDEPRSFKMKAIDTAFDEVVSTVIAFVWYKLSSRTELR